MSTKMQITRRRKWKRYKTKGGAIVLLQKPRLIEIGKPKLIELGPIIDISMGGLAVQYIENKSRKQETDTISIAIPALKVSLDDLECKVISEKVIAALPDGKQIYHRCVQFINLTSIQSLQLESFIRKHTFHTIPDRRSGKDRRHSEDPNFDRNSDCRSGIDRRVFTR